MPYYWVMTYADNGRGFMVNKAFNNDSRAEAYLDERYEGKGEIFPTDSSNKVEAAREIRAQMAERKGGKAPWGRNFGHKKPGEE